MTPNIPTLCPPPEGMEWYRRGPDFILRCGDGSDVLIVEVSPFGFECPDITAHRVTAHGSGDGRAFFQVHAETHDLPAAYLRTLTAVGLAPDAEKDALRAEVESLRDALKVTEGVVGSAYRQVQTLCAEVTDLRRRLTWSEEVPTEAGAYAVTWSWKIDSDVYAWTRYDCGTRPWESAAGERCTDVEMQGGRFLPLANLRETP
jgi:hypothetical protein